MNSLELDGTSLYGGGMNPAMFTAVKLLSADNDPRMEKNLVFARLNGGTEIGRLFPDLREESGNE